MARKIFLKCMMCLFSTFVIPQSNKLLLDSVKDLIANSTEDTSSINLLLTRGFLSKSNLDSSIYYLDMALSSAKKNSIDSLVAKTYWHYGATYHENKMYKEAILNFNKALALYIEMKDGDGITSVYIYLGYLHLNIGNLNTALEYNEKALESAKKTGNLLLLGLAYGNTGAVFANFNKDVEAREYYLEALSLFRKIGNKRHEKWILGNIGNGYFMEKEYSKALEYFKAAKKIDNYQDLNINGYIYKSIGDVFRVDHEFDSALFYYNEALKHDITRDIKKEVAADYLSFGILYEEYGQFDSALFYYTKSLNLAGNIQDKIGQRDASERLFKYYLSSIPNNKINEYFRIYSDITDSIFTEKNNRQMVEAKVKFDVEKSEQEILKLRYEKRITRIKFYALTAILCLVLVIVILLYSRQKIKLKEKFKYKNKELVNFALHIVQNIEFIELVKEKIVRLKKKLTQKSDIEMIKEIEAFIIQKLSVEKQRKEFQLKIELVNQTFFYSLEKKFPGMTSNEKKLAALLWLKFSSKEIASLFNITEKSIEMKRYRLRQKLGVEKDENIPSFLNKF